MKKVKTCHKTGKIFTAVDLFLTAKKKKNQIVAPNTILSYQISLALNWSLNGVGSSSRFAFHTLARPA